MNFLKGIITVLIIALLSTKSFAQKPIAHFTMPCKVLCLNGPGGFVGNNAMTFTDNSTGGAPTSWSWTFAGGTPASANLSNPGKISYSSPGVYFVSYTVTNGSGSSTFTDTITALQSCGAQYTTTAGATTFCDAKCVDFKDTSNFMPDTWSWSFSGPAAVTPPNSFDQDPDNICFPSTAGKYNVQLVATRSGNSKGDCFFQNTRNFAYITIGDCAKPKAAFSVETSICTGQCVTFNDSSINGSGLGGVIKTWQWAFSGGSITTSNLQAPPPVCYNTAGVYQAILIVTTDSLSDTAYKQITVNNCNGIKSVNESEAITIYPNPFTNNFTIKWNNANENASVKVCDILGKVIARFNLTSDKPMEINLPSLTSGVYILNITTDKGNYAVKKLVKF